MSEEQETRQDDGQQDPEALAADAHDEDISDEMKKMEEEGPPENLEDWPDKGPAMYETYGGPEGHHGYDEGVEAKLGPSSVRHKEGGAVEVEGEEVDDPEEYKGDPIPGGPTDPNAPDIAGERDGSDDEESGGESGESSEEEDGEAAEDTSDDTSDSDSDSDSDDDDDEQT